MKEYSGFSKAPTRTSLSECLVSYPGHPFGGILSLWRPAVSIFYSPIQQGNDHPVSNLDYEKLNMQDISNHAQLKKIC